VVEKRVVEGTAVKAGERLLRLADLSRVWVEAYVYEYELPFVDAGMQAQVRLPNLPGQVLVGRVSYVSPVIEDDTRTARVRVELDNPQGLIRPMSYAEVDLSASAGDRVMVPAAAVIYAGDSRIVFVDLGDGYFEPRRVQTGLRNAAEIEILEGLAAGEIAVTSGNFLIAAESKLKSGIDQW
jgi:Cu(I)/Ag(I) efflux system membrane fusion protein